MSAYFELYHSERHILYDHVQMVFEETPPRNVKHFVKNGKVVNVLKLDKGDIQLDEDDFSCENPLVKYSVGNYDPMKHSAGMK